MKIQEWKINAMERISNYILSQKKTREILAKELGLDKTKITYLKNKQFDKLVETQTIGFVKLENILQLIK